MSYTLKVLLLCSLLFTLNGCFRSHYYNFSSSSVYPVPLSKYESKRVTGSQAFFIWGLVPITKHINAQQLCNGSDNITAIKMKRTAGQVFMNLFVPSLIYQPWSGAVYCRPFDTQNPS